MVRGKLVLSPLRSRGSSPSRNRRGYVAAKEERDTDLEDLSGFMMGALHTLDDFEPDEPEYKGPKVNMGYQPPAKAWAKPRKS